MKKLLEKIKELFKRIKELVVAPKPVQATPIATPTVESPVEPLKPSKPDVLVSTPTPISTPEAHPVEQEPEVPKIPAVLYYKDVIEQWDLANIALRNTDLGEFLKKKREFLDSLPPPPGSAGGKGEVPPINLKR